MNESWILPARALYNWFRNIILFDKFPPPRARRVPPKSHLFVWRYMTDNYPVTLFFFTFAAFIHRKRGVKKGTPGSRTRAKLRRRNLIVSRPRTQSRLKAKSRFLGRVLSIPNWFRGTLVKRIAPVSPGEQKRNARARGPKYSFAPRVVHA